MATVCLVSLWPTGEPHYKGRSLTEWLDSRRTAYTPAQASEAHAAILAIGTNAVPYLLKRMQSKPGAWRMSLYRKLPNFMQQNNTVRSWGYWPYLRANTACESICDLGTSAAGAIPELEAMTRDLNDPGRARFAFVALAGIGEPAIPVLRAALADTNRLERFQIVNAIFSMTNYKGRTNASFSLVIEALNHEDANVRAAATNAIGTLFP